MSIIIEKINSTKISDSYLYSIHSFLLGKPENITLSGSIQFTGIVHPPTLLELGSGNYDIICGRQRLSYSQSLLKKSDCFCRIVQRTAPQEDILRILLEDQYLHSDLSIVEQAHFVDLCHRLIPNKNDFKHFLSSIPAGRITYGSQYLFPITQLDNELQKSIHFSIVSEKVLPELLKLELQEQSRVVHLFKTLQLGANNQKKFLSLFTELLKREGIELINLLATADIQQILTHEEMNIPQKTAQLLNFLSCRCSPLLSSSREEFKAEVERLKLPKNCELSASKSFEKDEVTLSIRFENFNKFKKRWSEIANKMK